jgi:3-hydroxyisobutyrate dehydrogenase
MASANDTTVAVLGAGGTMGLAMARNIARAGMSIRAWNRTADKAHPLRDDGAEVLDTPAEAARGAGVVLTMLSDADAVLAATEGDDGWLAGAGEGVVWLQMSTIGEEGIGRCAALARERGIDLVDAPVLGTKQPAEQGKLVVLAAGSEDVRDRVQPIFDAVGQRSMWVGEAGKATLLKMVVNSWIVTVTEGGAETIALAEGLGIDPQLFFEAIEGGGLDLPYLRMKGKAILERDFTPSFKLALAAKDARLVEEAAERRHLDLPMLATIAERMTEGAREHGEEDMCATYLTSQASVASSPSE